MNDDLCDICRKPVQWPSHYGDWNCPHCSQAYAYDEGLNIRLNDAQLELLRNGAVESRENEHYRGVEELGRPRRAHNPEIAGSNPAAPSHDAVPEAKADSDEVRTDKAATSHRRDGTGDTPSDAEIDALEFVVVMGGVANGWDKDILRQWLIRLRPEFDSAKAIKDGESDRSQPIGSPAKTNPTQPRNGTPAEGSVPGEGSVPSSRSENEPVAWAVMQNDWYHSVHLDDYKAVKLATAANVAGAKNPWNVVPLYRHPPCQDLLQKNFTLTDEEREAVETAVRWLEPYPQVASTLRKLLERLGGGR